MDTEDQMILIMDALNDTVTPVPDPGTLCTFLYQAKTPQNKIRSASFSLGNRTIPMGIPWV